MHALIEGTNGVIGRARKEEPEIRFQLVTWLYFWLLLLEELVL